MKLSKKQKIVIFSSIISLILVITVSICLALWLDNRRRNAEIIREAIMNPQKIDPKKFLNTLDSSFKNLPEEKKNDILKDRKQFEKYMAKATGKELEKSFNSLFYLPKPVRTKIIKMSADHLLATARKHPDKVIATFESPAGNGALKGASKYFLLNLSGKQKAELAPLTTAMYKVVRQQSKGIKLDK